jgi:hypothetical protein
VQKAPPPEPWRGAPRPGKHDYMGFYILQQKCSDRYKKLVAEGEIMTFVRSSLRAFGFSMYLTSACLERF